MVGGFACAADRLSEESWQQRLDQIVKGFGSGAMARTIVPSAADPDSIARFAKFERMSSSPGALRTLLSLNRQIDVSAVLPTLQVPTLVLHRRTDAQVCVAQGRKLAEGIPGAKYIEYPAGDHCFWTGDTDALYGDIEEFVTGQRDGAEPEVERVLATVLFTDIVDSTRSAADMGDQRWRRLLDDHDRLAQDIVGKHRGCLVKNIEKMFETGNPPYPVERTLMTSGILDFALESRIQGYKKLNTPQLAQVRYQPSEASTFCGKGWGPDGKRLD